LFCSAAVEWVFEREFKVRIVVAGQVIEDSQGFHHREPAVVVIDDYWDATIRAKLDEPCLLLIIILEFVKVLVRVFFAISLFEFLK